LLGPGVFVVGFGFLVGNVCGSGPCNLVAPNPVTNEEFTRVLGRVLRRPEPLNVPRFALKLALGDMALETLLASQRVRPRVLLEAGFRFTYPTLESAFRAELH
jgi:NAD dependent epimerase/dehydratase family enzyme